MEDGLQASQQATAVLQQAAAFQQQLEMLTGVASIETELLRKTQDLATLAAEDEAVRSMLVDTHCGGQPLYNVLERFPDNEALTCSVLQLLGVLGHDDMKMAGFTAGADSNALFRTLLASMLRPNAPIVEVAARSALSALLSSPTKAVRQLYQGLFLKAAAAEEPQICGKLNIIADVVDTCGTQPMQWVLSATATKPLAAMLASGRVAEQSSAMCLLTDTLLSSSGPALSAHNAATLWQSPLPAQLAGMLTGGVQSECLPTLHLATRAAELLSWLLDSRAGGAEKRVSIAKIYYALGVDRAASKLLAGSHVAEQPEVARHVACHLLGHVYKLVPEARVRICLSGQAARNLAATFLEPLATNDDLVNALLLTEVLLGKGDADVAAQLSSTDILNNAEIIAGGYRGIHNGSLSPADPLRRSAGKVVAAFLRARHEAIGGAELDRQYLIGSRSEPAATSMAQAAARHEHRAHGAREAGGQLGTAHRIRGAGTLCEGHVYIAIGVGVLACRGFRLLIGRFF